MNGPDERQLTAHYLLAETYRTYERHFRPLSRIALIPAILALVFSVFGREIILRQLAEAFPRTGSQTLSTFTDFLVGAVYFVLGAFVFARTAIDLADPGEPGSPAASDAHRGPRERVDGLLAIGLSWWISFFLCFSIVQPAAQRLLGHRLMAGMAGILAVFLPLVLLAGVLSRLGLVIPEIMHDRSMALGQAIRNSLRKTEGSELFFLMFVAKLGAMAWIIWWLCLRANAALWISGLHTSRIFPWIYPVLYTISAVFLEPILFVAFVVFWREKSPEAEAIKITGNNEFAEA